MADDPVIFRGSPADFSIFVDDFERRRRHGSTVFHVFPFRRGYVEAWPPESEHTAQIAAYGLPDKRSLVQCETLSPAAWPDIEPHWRDLLAELARLGLLEKAEAEPPASPTQEMIDTVRGWPVAKAAGQIKAHYYRDKGVTQSTFYRWQREVRKWEEAQQCHDTAEIA